MAYQTKLIITEEMRTISDQLDELDELYERLRSRGTKAPGAPKPLDDEARRVLAKIQPLEARYITLMWKHNEAYLSERPPWRKHRTG